MDERPSRAERTRATGSRRQCPLRANRLCPKALIRPDPSRPGPVQQAKITGGPFRLRSRPGA